MTTTAQFPPEGPWIVGDLVDLARAGWNDLPEKVRKLYDDGRVVFLPTGMAILGRGGHSTVLNSRDILSFRDDCPYAVVHLGLDDGTTHK